MDARFQQASIQLELAPNLPPVVADGVQLQQVVLNLIRNGIEARDNGSAGGAGDIFVRTSLVDDGHIQVSVVDQGAGIERGAEDQVFEPFFTTKETGMGMGLSIGRSIITAHGGRMWFVRNEDRGMTFSFTLPTEPEANDGKD